MAERVTHPIIASDDLFQALTAAGIVDGDYCQRVVIDLRAGCVPIIHIQRVGDERLLRVIQTLEGVEVDRVTL